MLEKVWITKDCTVLPDEIVKEAGNTILAKILVNRGIDTVSKIRDFLNPLKMSITHPSVFKDMQKAVSRIKTAIENKEKITVFGDFDADGVTSTAVLYKTLIEIGALVDYYLPDRDTESHGLNTKALVNIISKRKSKLIITVDCGISDVPQVNFAKGFKVDVIITDHHEAPLELPDAYAVLNPKAPDALSDDLKVEELESLGYLAGVGVAFKLSCALLEEFGKEDFINVLLPLVAVGTIADIVPLLGENRCYVNMGLTLIQNGLHKGLEQLLKSAGIQDISSVTSETVAFTIAPRINAAGRLATADKAFNLLVSEDEDDIQQSITFLNDLNLQRQELCDEIFNEAVCLIEETPALYKNAVILFRQNWHIGIIGIVASKLIEKYNKPVFLMTKSSPESSEIRCSCRSIQGINIYDILSLHSDLFIGFGGHSMAGGFSFDEKNISFENFRKILSDTIEESASGIDLTPRLNIDAVLNAKDVNITLINDISRLQPFGAKNETPVFVLKNLKLDSYKMMGQNENHLKMYTSFEQQIFECVKWNMPDFSMSKGCFLDIAFYPKINVFNGNTSVQLDIKDIHSDALPKKIECPFDILDHRQKTDILSQVVDYINNSKKHISLFIDNKATAKKFDGKTIPKENVFGSYDIPDETEQLMFFDCPASISHLKKIIFQTNPKIIHLMNFDAGVPCADEFLKVLSGMLKYCSKNKNGLISTKQITGHTQVSEFAARTALELFESIGMININESNEDTFKIQFKSSAELAKIKQHDLYNTLVSELDSVKNFKDTIFKADIEEIKKMLV